MKIIVHLTYFEGIATFPEATGYSYTHQEQIVRVYKNDIVEGFFPLSSVQYVEVDDEQR